MNPVKIKNFSNYYCDENGNIFKMKQGQLSPCSHWIDKDNYHRIMMYNDDGKRKSMAVHRVVYQCFVGELIDGLTIDHQDSIKSNNHFSNLVQMSFSENSKKENVGKTNPRSNRKLTPEIINSVFKMRSEGVSFNEISRRIGMSPAMSWHIIKGKTYYDISTGKY